MCSRYFLDADGNIIAYTFRVPVKEPVRKRFNIAPTQEAPVIAVGAEYLRIVAWNFVASGLIFTCSGMFQALGNTLPALLSSASRILMYVIPAVWLSTRPGFALRHLWWLAVMGVAIQAVITMSLLRRELGRRAPVA